MKKKGSKEYLMWVELRGTTEKFSQDMNKAVGQVTRAEQQITGLARNIQKVFHAALVIGGVAAISKLTSQLGKLAEQGEVAGSIADGFHRLGGSSVEIEKARRAVLGMADSYDLMQIANKGLIANLPGWNESFASIADLGARVADVLNQDTTQSIEQLSDAIIRGQSKALIPLGFTFTDTANKALVSAEALRQLPEVLSRLAPATDSVANAQTAFNKALGEAVKEVGIAINENETLILAWRELEAAVKSIDWKAIGDDIASTAGIFANLTSTVLPHVTAAFQGWAYEVDKLFGNGASGQQKRLLDEIHHLEGNLKSLDSWKPANLVAWLIGQHGSTRDTTLQQLEAKRKALLEIVHATNAFDGGPSNEPNFKPLLGADPEEAKNKGRQVVKDVKEAQKAAAVEVSDEWAEQQKRAHRESVQFWESTFQNAITGMTFDLEDALKQAAVGFASEMAASFTGLSFEGGIKGFGSKLAESIFGTGAGLLGRPEGVAGPLMENGSFMGMGAAISSFVPAAAAAVGTYLAGRSLQDLIHGKTDNSLQGIAGRAQLAILSSGVSEVARLFSAFGGSNAGHDARKNVAGFIENATGKDFKVGASSKFDTDDGFAALRKLDKETQDFFKGFGQVLTSVVGVGSDASEQIASLLVENTDGSVNKAKAMWKSLGMSFEDAQETIIALGIEAGKTWDQIEGEIAAAERLSRPGRDGKGDYVGAFQDIIDSNAKGMEATNAVVSNGIEAAEKQFKNFEEWKAALKTQFAPEQVDIFFQALSQRGVTNFDQLENASVRTSGAIIADMKNLGFAFEDVTAKIKEAELAMRDLTSSSPNNVEGVDIPKFGKGGIVTRPTLAIVGEAGPEIIMPMNKLSGANPAMRAAGGGGMVVNIDARGAAPGVDQAILRAMREVSEASVARGINNFVRTQSRGGRGV